MLRGNYDDDDDSGKGQRVDECLSRRRGIGAPRGLWEVKSYLQPVVQAEALAGGAGGAALPRRPGIHVSALGPPQHGPLLQYRYGHTVKESIPRHFKRKWKINE